MVFISKMEVFPKQFPTTIRLPMTGNAGEVDGLSLTAGQHIRLVDSRVMTHESSKYFANVGYYKSYSENQAFSP